MIFRIDGSLSTGTSACAMPGASGSISRMVSPWDVSPLPSWPFSIAICTRASCGQKVRSRTNSVSRPMRAGRRSRWACSAAGVLIQMDTIEGE
jgi:hypothetical protein